MKTPGEGFQRPKKLECDKKVSTDTYGRFIAEPFERGFGITIGNALRRFLLSSIQGAAVTAVKFDGIYHEFSTLPGVIEDVTDIILNIKGLKIKLHDNNGSKTIFLHAEGKKEVKASDIELVSDVEILNPDHHIATFDKDGKLNIEMTVKWGRGYVPAEKNKEENQPLEVISIDSVFSPINKVNFFVENTRVGGSTDYERLILEVWTNGSITPDDAIAHSAKILKDSLQIFINFEEESVEIKPAPVEIDEKRTISMAYLQKSVDELELSVRSANCLKNAEIQTIGELVQKTEDDMLKTRNFGKKSLDEIKEILQSMDLYLGMKIDDLQLEKVELENVELEKVGENKDKSDASLKEG